jgi:NNP family nitrate/nitrite transporter-like MFS transporter
MDTERRAMTEKHPPYRWVMVGLMWLMLFALGLNWLSFAPLILLVMQDLGMTFEESGILMGLVPVALVILCIPSGLFADRIGVKKTVLIGGAVISAFGLLRGASSTPAMLALTMFLCGAGYAITYPPLPKLIGAWFPPGERGTATGVVFTGLEVGMSASFVLVPALLLPLTGSWQGVFIVIGAVSLALTVMWAAFAKEALKPITHPSQRRPLDATFTESLHAVTRNRHLWIAGLVGFFLLAPQMGFLGFLPVILELRGMDPIAAGVLASVPSWLMIPGSLVMPKISDRVRLRRPFFWASSIIAGGALYFATTTVNAPLWISLIVYGFLNGGMAALVVSMPAELTELRYAATAGGFFLVVCYLGAIVGPSLAGFLATQTGSFSASILACVALTEANVVLGLMLRDPKHRDSS